MAKVANLFLQGHEILNAAARQWRRVPQEQGISETSSENLSELNTPWRYWREIDFCGQGSKTYGKWLCFTLVFNNRSVPLRRCAARSDMHL